MGNAGDLWVFVLVCSGRRYVEMGNAGDVWVCSFRCAAGGGMCRWITLAMCGCVFVLVCSGRKYVEMSDVGDVCVCVQ